MDHLPGSGIQFLENQDGVLDRYMTVTFVRPIRYYGVEYGVEVSPNLVEWEAAPVVEIQAEPIEGTGLEKVTLQEEVALPEDEVSRFIRVRLSVED